MNFLNKKTVLIGILLIGAFLRLYRLDKTLQFLGDQGRDALIARRLLIDHDPVFIGPVTSVGNMYLGPAYYYFMLPFFALTYPSPMGPAYAVALLSLLTIYMIYKLGTELVGEKPALFAAFLFSLGWVFIAQARFSWNPNPAPFVSLIMIWATHRAWKKDSKYWIIVSIVFSILIQLHYLTLLALPSAGLVWLLSLVDTYKKRPETLKRFFAHTLISIFIFLVSLTPLALFDLKHDFLNIKAFYNVTAGDQDQIRSDDNLLLTVMESWGRTHQILFEITTNNLRWLNHLMIICVIILVGVKLRMKNNKYQSGLIVLLVWLFVGIAGTSLYKSSIFDHYIAYLFPVTCLFLGTILATLWQMKWGKGVVFLFLSWFVVANLYRYNYEPASWTVGQMEEYSKEIAKYVEAGEPYTLVGINSYDDIYAMNYRYYLTAYGKKPLDTEDANSARKLVIVNEFDEPSDEVVDLPIYEIVIFPQKKEREEIHFENAPDLIILRR